MLRIAILSVAPVAIASISFGNVASAAVVVNVVQSAGNVVATATGKLNVTGLTRSPVSEQEPSKDFLFANTAAITLGSTSFGVVYRYLGSRVPASFGLSSSDYIADSMSGSSFFIFGALGQVALPFAYVSDSSFTSGAVFNNRTIAGLGLSPGQYVFTAPNDTIIVNIEGATSGVPESATWATMLAGFGLVGGALRRRERIASARIACAS